MKLSIGKVKPAVLLVLAILVPGSLRAQSGPEKGGTELELWTSGGHSVAGGRGQTGIWNLGLRYGWIFTDAHGPGFLKGRFEYAVDAVPAYLLFQRANTAYGVGLNPLNLRWNLSQRGSLVPYLELSGGVLFTTHDVPPHTSAVNFTPAAAAGVYTLRKKYALAVELRYLHISDAGLSKLNPGINTVEVRLGLGKFNRGR
jgi:lipid A 3-O-deacylase